MALMVSSAAMTNVRRIYHYLERKRIAIRRMESRIETRERDQPTLLFGRSQAGCKNGFLLLWHFENYVSTVKVQLLECDH